MRKFKCEAYKCDFNLRGKCNSQEISSLIDSAKYCKNHDEYLRREREGGFMPLAKNISEQVTAPPMPPCKAPRQEITNITIQVPIDCNHLVLNINVNSKAE
jgi:hypothetical protein